MRRSLLFSFGEKYIGLAMQLGTVMILSRILTPAETGLFSVAAGLVGIAQAVRDFGVGTYILQERDLTRSRLGAALWISVLMGTGLAIGFVAAAPAIAANFGAPDLAGVIDVLSLNFILVAIAAIGGARLRRSMDFRTITLIGIGGTAAGSVASVIFAISGFGASGLAWASVTGIVAALVGNLIRFPDLILPPGFSQWWRILRFGGVSMGATILQEIGYRAPDIVIGRVLGFEAAGFFSRGNGLISLFESAFLNAVMPVSTTTLAMHHRNRETLATPFLQVLDYLLTVSWPALAILGCLSYPIITLMFGPQWLQSVSVGPPLCIAGALFVISRLAVSLTTATGAVKSGLLIQCIGVPVRVLGLAVGAELGFEAAAWGLVAANCVHAALSLVVTTRLLATTPARFIRPLLSGGLATAATLAVPLGVLALLPMPTHGVIGPAAAILAGGALGWGAYLLAARHPIIAEGVAFLRHVVSVRLSLPRRLRAVLGE
ncbi:MAG: oligosaccharide flippase family protein [Rhodopila sp.]